MNLPLPQFLPSALPQDEESREALILFEALLPYYEAGFKTALAFEPGTPAEFPAILSTWLLSIMQRSRLLAWGIIQSVNAANEITMMLSMRALLENVAYLCHARDSLAKTYRNELTRSDMTWTAFQLRFARRHVEHWEDFTEREKEVTRALNVLTALKRLDKYAYEQNAGDTRPDLFTNWYMRLCEFCHPNVFGIEAGTHQSVADNEYSFHIEPRISEGAFAAACGAAFSAQYHFFNLYNECWGLMIENGEKLPRLEPDSDPRIVIE
jgi:hypothetical protein